MPYLSPNRSRPRRIPPSSTSAPSDNPGAKSERQVYTVELGPEPNVNAIRSLRLGLKMIFRYYGLRCTSAHEGTVTDAFLFDRLSAPNSHGRRLRPPARETRPVSAKAGVVDQH